jgi:hypothetical protein
MKMGLVVAIAALLLVGCNSTNAPSVRSSTSSTRIQFITDEQQDQGEWIFHFYVFRDRETGQEIMCMRNEDCWLTGRMIDETGKQR